MDAKITVAEAVAAPWPMMAMLDANGWHGVKYRCEAAPGLTMIERTPRRSRGFPWNGKDSVQVPMGRRYQFGGVEYERLADAVDAFNTPTPEASHD
jgi:hypothetical protein